ncbi:hypothetical protein [Nocardia iowensis]|uniref:Uncharacterized protein n=1 Tax=Nocardia iowensis TaxID=204891 RepID=A0ABX8RUK3_NOCIO|nr:hypothetical protein [Nocardia iowensis]QXN93314.1 hypothetical protein KV110_09590 [Nocardia iowensis]
MSGTDPDYISSMEHFESMRHEEIYAKTQQINAAEVLQASVAWLEVAATLSTSFPLTRGSVDRVMNSMEWKGAAAEAAYASTRSFASSVDELAAIMGQVGARLGGVAAAAEAVKIAVAPPGSSGPIGAVARLLEAAHVIDAKMAEETMRQEAVLAMNMVYKPAYGMAGKAVPALPPPPELPTDVKPAPFVPQQRTVPPTEYTPQQPSQPDGKQPNVHPTVPAPAPSAPESQAPPSTTTPPRPVPDPTPTPTPTPTSPPTTQQAPPSATPTPEAPPTQQAPPPPPTTQAPPPPPPTTQAPPPSPTEQAPPLPEPPAQPPLPEPPPQPPIPGPAEPPVPLPDPGGQPGVTGPIPEEDEQPQPPSTTNQPGVVPSQK